MKSLRNSWIMNKFHNLLSKISRRVTLLSKCGPMKISIKKSLSFNSLKQTILPQIRTLSMIFHLVNDTKIWSEYGSSKIVTSSYHNFKEQRLQVGLLKTFIEIKKQLHHLSPYLLPSHIFLMYNSEILDHCGNGGGNLTATGISWAYNHNKLEGQRVTFPVVFVGTLKFEHIRYLCIPRFVGW